MTNDDPYARRRTGLRRVRVVTAGLGAAALAGAGALTVALATHDTSAQAATQNTTGQSTTQGTTSGTGVISAPQQLPTGGGSVNASSGGS